MKKLKHTFKKKWIQFLPDTVLPQIIKKKLIKLWLIWIQSKNKKKYTKIWPSLWLKNIFSLFPVNMDRISGKPRKEFPLQIRLHWLKYESFFTKSFRAESKFQIKTLRGFPVRIYKYLKRLSRKRGQQRTIFFK